MKIFAWFVLPLMIVLGLCVANIMASAQAVNMGERLHTADAKQAVARKQQRELDAALAEARSLHSLKTEALAQGYVPVSSVATMISARPVAMR